MKLESLKSEKFRKLENEEMNRVNGGKSALVGPDTGYTVTWTKAENKVDDICTDCD